MDKKLHVADSITINEGVVTKSDLNGYGLMHGGRLLTICDEIGYLAAKKLCGCDCLTRAAHDIEFISVLNEGDPYSVEAKVLLTGKTTIWVRCSVRRNDLTVMRSVFVYIAVDASFHAIEVPEVVADSEQEAIEQAHMQMLRRQLMERN